MCDGARCVVYSSIFAQLGCDATPREPEAAEPDGAARVADVGHLGQRDCASACRMPHAPHNPRIPCQDPEYTRFYPELIEHVT